MAGPVGSFQTALLTPTIRLALEDVNPYGLDTWDEYFWEIRLIGADVQQRPIWDDTYLVSDGHRGMITNDVIKGITGGVADARARDENDDPDDLIDDPDGYATKSGHIIDFLGVRYNYDSGDPDGADDPPKAFRATDFGPTDTYWQLVGYTQNRGVKVDHIVSPQFQLDAADHPGDGIIHWHTIAPTSASDSESSEDLTYDIEIYGTETVATSVTVVEGPSVNQLSRFDLTGSTVLANISLGGVMVTSFTVSFGDQTDLSLRGVIDMGLSAAKIALLQAEDSLEFDYDVKVTKPSGDVFYAIRKSTITLIEAVS